MDDLPRDGSGPEDRDDLRNRRACQPNVVRSEQLLQGGREVIILHNDESYRLMVTRNGKLILQK